MIQRENEITPAPVNSVSGNELLYDLSILLEMDDQDYVIEIVTIFLSDTPRELKAMKEAIQATNAEAVYKKAHKLKSSAGVLQASALIDALTEIERTAKSGNTGSLQHLHEQIMSRYKALELALQKLMKTMKS